MKLATKSSRNWKKRFLVLNPYNLSYYNDEKTNKPKGELQIGGDATVTALEYDKKHGYLFKYQFNLSEMITLAASNDIDRQHWIKSINSAISYSSHYRKETLSLVATSRLGLPTTVKKFFILSHQLLTYHPDYKTTSQIEGVININEDTTLELVDEKNRKITLVDSDIKRTTITIQFGKTRIDEEVFNDWLSCIKNMINDPLYSAVTPVSKELKKQSEDTDDKNDEDALYDPVADTQPEQIPVAKSVENLEEMKNEKDDDLGIDDLVFDTGVFGGGVDSDDEEFDAPSDDKMGEKVKDDGDSDDEDGARSPVHTLHNTDKPIDQKQDVIINEQEPIEEDYDGISADEEIFTCEDDKPFQSSPQFDSKYVDTINTNDQRVSEHSIDRYSDVSVSPKRPISTGGAGRGYSPVDDIPRKSDGSDHKAVSVNLSPAILQ